jgi:multisite-specific tRNA:(cytosine-C5)-methyltransferase
VSTEDLKEY